MMKPIGHLSWVLAGFATLLVCLSYVAYAQQSPYQVPPPTYPAPTQPYPAPTQPYPAPTQTYPQNPSYPSPYPAQAPSYPAQYPAPAAPAGYPQGVQPSLPQSHFFRDLFAQTIAAVLQTSTGGLLGAITGRIMEWFTRKGASPANMTAYPNNGQYPQYGTTAFAATPGYPTTSTYPTTAYPTPTYPSQSTTYPTAPQPAATYPQTPGYPVTAAQPPYPSPQGAAPAAAPALIYDARTGQMVPANANPYATRGLGIEGAMYAGIAYEVHITGTDGTFSAPVNSATYDFHTGDKFMVYYRPSLPGHMEIYSINATGKRTLIDSSNMAAGAMTGLGPYQFTNDGGDETLLLILSPCSTPQLITTTRDIVKVDVASTPSPQANPIQLGSCGAPTARGLDVRTRDIEKVAVEGSTSFALDPVSPNELKSGQVTPREIPIVFHHR